MMQTVPAEENGSTASGIGSSMEEVLISIRYEHNVYVYTGGVQS